MFSYFKANNRNEIKSVSANISYSKQKGSVSADSVYMIYTELFLLYDVFYRLGEVKGEHGVDNGSSR